MNWINVLSYTDIGYGVNVGELFVKCLEEFAVNLYNKYEAEIQDMIFTPEDKLAYTNATHCHICNLPLKKDTCGATSEASDDITVRDHCHLTGKFRGAAHQSCNLNYKIPKFYPVVIHNLSGYDAHLFIKYLGQAEDGKFRNVKTISQTDEKYITISV